MKPNRRTFVTGCLALPAAAMVRTPALAEIQLGTSVLTTASDGHLTLPREFIFGELDRDIVATLDTDFALPADQLLPECNLALYRDGDNTVLFDAGSGPDFMPSAGTITDSLDTLGLVPDDITHVVFTHAHPDHIWGVLDDFDDPLFYNAAHMMGRKEWDYWWNPETVNAIGEARAAFAVGAKRRMEAIENSVTLFDAGEEILPGIQALATHGHTPGHMSFEVRSGNQAALVLGDAIGNHHLAFRHPDMPSGADQISDQAIATRKMLFDRITNEDLTVVGFHLPGGGIGRVEPVAGAFAFLPEPA